jgi:hypothetical protein
LCGCISFRQGCSDERIEWQVCTDGDGSSWGENYAEWASSCTVWASLGSLDLLLSSDENHQSHGPWLIGYKHITALLSASRQSFICISIPSILFPRTNLFNFFSLQVH